MKSTEIIVGNDYQINRDAGYMRRGERVRETFMAKVVAKNVETYPGSGKRAAVEVQRYNRDGELDTYVFPVHVREVEMSQDEILRLNQMREEETALRQAEMRLASAKMRLEQYKKAMADQARLNSVIKKLNDKGFRVKDLTVQWQEFVEYEVEDIHVPAFRVTYSLSVHFLGIWKGDTQVGKVQVSVGDIYETYPERNFAVTFFADYFLED